MPNPFNPADDSDYYPTGDARRCRVHPHVTTSSADGMHDAPCGHCEHEMYLQEQKEEWDELVAAGYKLPPEPEKVVYVPAWDDFPF